MSAGPFKSSTNAGEWPGIVTEPILDDRQAEYGKASWESRTIGRTLSSRDQRISD
jgi:hypothetical protein